MMKLKKIYVKENERQENADVQYDEVTMTVYEELEKQQSDYIMQEYSRDKKRILRIGVEIESAAKVIVIGEDVEINLVQSVINPSIWYEKRIGWYENQYVVTSDSCFGINACGRFTVIAYDQYGYVLGKEYVMIIPSSLTIEQYTSMQYEVKSMLEDLAFDKEFGEEIKEIQLKLFPVEKLWEHLQQMDTWLQKIYENPSQKLIQTRMKKKVHQIKKWDAKARIEQAIHPYREKISVLETVASSEIEEHQMIHTMLQNIKERIMQEQSVEKFGLKQVKQNEKSLLANGITSFNREMYEIMQEKHRLIQEDIRILEERATIWTSCLEFVNTHLLEPVIGDVGKEIEYTHLFIREPSYAAIMHIYDGIKELQPQFHAEEAQFVKAMMNSPKLYEVWILLQLIKQFIRSNLLIESKRAVFDSLYKVDNLKGWHYKFASACKTHHFALYYEKDIIGANGRLLTPDYLISYLRNNVWETHSLDAKYKPYTTLGEKALRTDLQRSCERYFEQIVGKNVEMRSAALLHINHEATHWNVEETSIATYKMSHFAVVPGQLENLEIYFKRLFHYFTPLQKRCTNCGGEAQVSKSYKKTYICQEDRLVWVDNHCNGCGFTPLMKYALYNYNEQVKNEWNVHCPNCGKDYHGNALTLTIFGERV